MKKKKKRKMILYAFLLILGIYTGYKNIEKKKVMIENKEIIQFILNHSFENHNIIKQIQNTKIQQDDVIKLLHKDYEEAISIPKEEKKNPIVYLYNSHPTEEYAITTIGEYSLNPTVIINNYIIEDILNKNGYQTITEEKSVKDILDTNNWNYASSYRASRILIEDAATKNPSLKYFIDIHRDSVGKDKTSIRIEDRDYAKVLFIVGLENENYQENLTFTEKINLKLEEYYPGISKGIYKKEGPGVNGIYNQDFSPKVILIEIGGYENTTTEVLNTSIAISKCLLEVFHEENN